MNVGLVAGDLSLVDTLFIAQLHSLLASLGSFSGHNLEPVIVNKVQHQTPPPDEKKKIRGDGIQSMSLLIRFNTLGNKVYFLLSVDILDSIQLTSIETEYFSQLKQVEEVPKDFPFKIEDKPGERTILLTRNYQDETIKVEVDIPQPGMEEEEDGDNDTEAGANSFIPLVVRITKGSGLCLEFGVTASPDEICIDSLSIKQPESSEDELAYEGPEFR